MNDGVILSSTDSAIEQIKEMPIAITIKNTNSRILLVVGSTALSAAHTLMGIAVAASTARTFASPDSGGKTAVSRERLSPTNERSDGIPALAGGGSEFLDLLIG
jgi:hypothetical protein